MKTILLPGYGNKYNYIKKLKITLEELGFNILVFDYSFRVFILDKYTEKGIYAPFEVITKRFIEFLEYNNLLKEPLNFVGFSQGGIIVLNACGENSDIIINKYISIASPHGGAFGKYFDVPNGKTVISEFEHNSNFMKGNGIYEKNALRVLTRYSKEKFLQIFSSFDNVAELKSSLRFKDYMKTFEVRHGDITHLGLPSNFITIARIIMFLIED